MITKRISIRLVFSLIVLTLSVVASFGQARNITREKYFDAINAASDKSDIAYPRRYTSSQQLFNNGTVNSWETTEEYLSASKFRKTIRSTEDGATVLNQYIRLGNIFYCKSGSKAWKKSRTDCVPINMTSSPPPDSETFSVEEVTDSGQKSLVYRMYTTHVWPKGADSVEFFSEQIVIVSDKGLQLSWKRTEGKTKGKEITERATGTYEFGVTGLNIVAPIK